MKIAISGSHGTGKTFAVLDVAKQYKLDNPNKNVTVITEIARECPFPINQNATVESELWMIATQIKKEIEAEKNYDIVITDRSLADYLAYTKYHFEDIYKAQFPFLEYYISTYDIIFYKSYEMNHHYLIEDGVRDLDKKFQKSIDKELITIYNLLKPNLKKFVEI